MADPIFKFSKLKTWDCLLAIYLAFGVDCPVDPLASPPYFLSPLRIYLNGFGIKSYNTFQDKG